MSKQNNWIAYKDRHPQPSDYPVWMAVEGYAQPQAIAWTPAQRLMSATLWCPALPPVPPAKEPSLAELDNAAFESWKAKWPNSWRPLNSECFQAGIANERAEIKKILDRSLSRSWYDAGKEIESRVKGHS